MFVVLFVVLGCQNRKQLLATSKPHPAKCFPHQGLWFYIHAPSGKTTFVALGRYGFLGGGGGFVYSCLLGMGVGFAFFVLCGGGWGVGGLRGKLGSGWCFPFRAGLGDFPCEGQIRGYLCLLKGRCGG